MKGRRVHRQVWKRRDRFACRKGKEVRVDYGDEKF